MMKSDSAYKMLQRAFLPLPGSCQENGFTLLEILLAIFILAILVSTVFVSFSAVFKNADTLEKHQKVYETARICMSRITEDLTRLYITPETAYSPPGPNDPPDPFRVVGDTHQSGMENFPKLRFASWAHLPLSGVRQDGIAEIIYYVFTTGEGIHQLRRKDSLIVMQNPERSDFEEDPADPILIEGITAMEITYIDAEDETFERWDSDSKDSKYGTPKAIRVAIDLGDEDLPLVFETLVRPKACRPKTE